MAFSVAFLSAFPILDLLIEPLRVFVVPYVVFFVVAELLFPRREAALPRVAAAATRRFPRLVVLRVFSDCCAQLGGPPEQPPANVLCSTFLNQCQDFLGWDPCYSHFPDAEDDPPSAVPVLYVSVEC